ncbi:long-chain-fatty-acid--CoA ligase [Desulfosarcina widdelii]|uniref:Long-chain-fatty-acid--CoA ligase n=1 Tax=Desulfosarcina widdelii TaxID=947919 RepID=A0A5K7Z0V4_9BACT|nr:class I adenylate-forming enzyme family protein [Desulfosarcina widdelii]BBO73091.1 long-chain-fatty-acid--CoA ligase [Desulfosarcina widdelii]
MTLVYDAKPWQNQYPVWLPFSVNYPKTTILDEFEIAFQNNPNGPCIIYFDNVYSYKDIRRKAMALAAGLKSLGLGKEDRIMVILQNIPQAAIACLAAWMCNSIVVPLNPMFTSKDLNHYIVDCEAKIVLCQEDVYKNSVRQAVANFDHIKVITTSPLDYIKINAKLPAQLLNIKKVLHSDTYDMQKIIDENNEVKLQPMFPKLNEIAYFVYTSGTTGPPKGAMLSHLNIIHNAVIYKIACRLNKEDVVLGVAPLFHVTGIVAHLAVAWHIGIPIVLFHRFDASDAIKLIEKFNVSFTVAAITVYIALLNHPNSSPKSFTYLKKAYSGGAPISPSTIDKIKNKIGISIHNVYGLTESSSPVTIVPFGMKAPVDETTGATSVGLVIPNHEAWIVNVEKRKERIPIGEEGELVVRGPGIISGYWKKPEETKNAFAKGCFYTGDIARFDKDGWCYIVDRKKDLINVSGFKVWPREVEDILYKHPAVKESAVVGVPDDYRGETVKAYVSLIDSKKGKITPEELISFCKKQMAAFKYPRIIEIMDELPKTVTGKILRRELKP